MKNKKKNVSATMKNFNK